MLQLSSSFSPHSRPLSSSSLSLTLTLNLQKLIQRGATLVLWIGVALLLASPATWMRVSHLLWQPVVAILSRGAIHLPLQELTEKHVPHRVLRPLELHGTGDGAVLHHDWL